MSDLPASVHVRDGSDGPTVEIEHPRARGTIHLHGAHLTSWVPAGGSEMLWLSPESEYGVGSAIRGGVPICFPWFAKGPGDWEPQHGFARRLPWRLADASDGPDGVTVRLRLTGDEIAADTPGRDRWPYAFEAEYVVAVGRELTIDLTVTNRDSRPFPVGGALHTYLGVNDITRTTLHGLDGVGYHDKTGEADQQQDGPVTFAGETDRIYETTGSVLVRDGDTDRLVVRSNGASHTVVWNPWRDKAGTMDDMSDDGWQQMVCVEATVPSWSAVDVAPGQRWHLGQHLTPA